MDGVRNALMIMVIAVCTLYLTGCANWQGMEFRVGVGNYNGAEETRTYTKDTEERK